MKSTALGVRLSQIKSQAYNLLFVGPWARYFGEGDGTPLQYSCLENSMDGGAWWAAVHGVTKSRARLSDFTFTFHFHALEKEMATLQCSCLENPRDGGAWWAAVCGVAQSQTRLKRLSSSSSSSSNSSSSRARYLTSNHLNLSLVKWG